MLEQMVADLKAAESSPGSAEEGEEEEVQADDSDNEQADPKPAYVEGNPHELLQSGTVDEAHFAKCSQSENESVHRLQKADGAAADGQETGVLVELIINAIKTSSAIKESSQGTQLRSTEADVRRWIEIGERCKRIAYHVREAGKEEEAVEELIEGTPLRYSWKTERRLQAIARQKSCSSEGE